MTNNKADQFNADQQQIAQFGKILSHPARIAIIELLSEKKEIKTGDISEFLPISRPTVSQHLKDLKEMGIIRGTISGQKIHYCLNMETLAKMKQEYEAFFVKTISSFMCSCDCE